MMYRHHHRHRLGLALAACAILLVLAPTAGLAERIKDIAQVGGVRSNPLVGYGLVVGLDGTGDRTSQTPFTIQTIKNMLAEMGVTVQSTTNPQLKNVAAVMVQAQLPPFAKPGQQIDVTVASLGNATSLRGGSLLMAPLKGADGQIYAIAQGNLVVGGFGAQGQSGSRVTVNTLNAGRIPNGATVERALPDSLAAGGGTIRLDLNTSDFTTAARVAAAVQGTFGADSAYAQDGDTIVVKAPTDPGARTQFLAAVENLELTPGTAPAKVVINARTGTVVIGANVHVLPAAVAHGSLTVTISENPQVSQPGALSNGNTVVTPQSTINVSSEGGRLFKLAGGGTLDEIVRAVNAVGATPSDLVAILQALQQAGALRAQLEII